MESAKVSVIIPAHNAAHLVRLTGHGDTGTRGHGEGLNSPRLRVSASPSPGLFKLRFSLFEKRRDPFLRVRQGEAVCKSFPLQGKACLEAGIHSPVDGGFGQGEGG